jgi:hypothetical protein
MGDDRPLTAEEKNAIRTLKALANRWPASLWLFSAGGTLHVMRNNREGRRVVDESGSMDRDASITTVNIPNDGGDW